MRHENAKNKFAPGAEQTRDQIIYKKKVCFCMGITNDFFRFCLPAAIETKKKILQSGKRERSKPAKMQCTRLLLKK